MWCFLLIIVIYVERSQKSFSEISRIIPDSAHFNEGGDRYNT